MNGKSGNFAGKRQRKWNAYVTGDADVNMAAIEQAVALELLSEEEKDDFYDLASIIIISALSEETKSVRITGYYEEIVPMYSDTEFKSHFRLNRCTLEMLCQELIATTLIPLEPNRGRECILPEKQILMSIWMLANQEGYRQISDRFDVPMSSVFRCFRRVCAALVCISNQFITWPTGKLILVCESRIRYKFTA